MHLIANVFLTLVLATSVSMIYWLPNIVRVVRTAKTMKYVYVGLGVPGCLTGALASFVVLQESVDPTYLLMGLVVMIFLMGLDKARAMGRTQKLKMAHQGCEVTLRELQHAQQQAGNVVPLPVAHPDGETTAEIELPAELRARRH